MEAHLEFQIISNFYFKLIIIQNVKLKRNQMPMEMVRYLVMLGVLEDMFPGMFRAFPSLLTLDIETNMKPVVEFLERIGVTNVGRFIT